MKVSYLIYCVYVIHIYKFRFIHVMYYSLYIMSHMSDLWLKALRLGAPVVFGLAPMNFCSRQDSDGSWACVPREPNTPYLGNIP